MPTIASCSCRSCRRPKFVGGLSARPSDEDADGDDGGALVAANDCCCCCGVGDVAGAGAVAVAVGDGGAQRSASVAFQTSAVAVAAAAAAAVAAPHQTPGVSSATRTRRPPATAGTSIRIWPASWPGSKTPSPGRTRSTDVPRHFPSPPGATCTPWPEFSCYLRRSESKNKNEIKNLIKSNQI